VTLHLVLRLRGGGSPPVDVGVMPGQTSSQPTMGIAAGGLIEQTIAPDTHAAGDWDVSNTLVFNIQILDSELFKKATGMRPPAPLQTATSRSTSLLPVCHVEVLMTG
jgi:hypothetical protein